MPAQEGTKERIHQPLWDTLICGTPGAFTPTTTLVGGPFTLFSGTRGSSIQLTNMTTSGMLPGEQTFMLLAMRVWLYFRGCTGPAYTSPPIALTDTVMYHHALVSLYWELNIEDKAYFVAPTGYLNAGAGLAGDLGTNTDVIITNGVPGANSIMSFARPIALVKNQPFMVKATVASLGTSAINLGTSIAALATGEVDIKCILDGLKLRGVL